LKAALLKQVDFYEHVISANTCQEIFVKLSEQLCGLCPNLDKIFYACEGSSAVEIAVKMSLHARKITEEVNRIRVMSLQHAYHGETLLALSLSDLGLFRKPYEDWLMPVSFLKNIPYVNSTDDPLWKDCASYWPAIELQLNKEVDSLTAIIVEPIVQGVAGMKIYSQDFLKRLSIWAKKQGVHLIADEIMTGFGRTGLSLACKHAAIIPDFICIGKGLTSGWLPMSAVLTTTNIYTLFYDDYEKDKTFMHSHTFSGNALSAAIALECLNVFKEEKIFASVQKKQNLFRQLMLEVAHVTQKLTNVRNIGAIVAADLVLDDEYSKRRLGYRVYQEAIKLGALLRPLGNTVYWLPPLNMKIETLHELQEITIKAIQNSFKSF
jgi:adenosylmethionine-8-amino-7-oxononanoate aminotransferase